MAETKKRQIIDVSSGSVSPAKTATRAKTAAAKSPVQKKAKAEAKQTHAIVTAENRSRAVKYRWGAVALWLLGLGFEVLTIMVINGYLYIPGNKLTYIIIGIVADLASVFAGSQLWKKSNHIDPASEKSKVKFFLWNNMGLIASLICFVPLIVLVLKEKDLDPKVKKIASIVAIAAAVIAGGTSIDWNPVSSEDLAAAQADAAYTDGVAYWTQFGKCYHLDKDCQSIRNSTTVYKGTIEQAFEAKRSKPCSFCASEEALENYRDIMTSGTDLGLDISNLLTSSGDVLDDNLAADNAA